MRMKNIIIVTIIAYLALCTVLVIEADLFKNRSGDNKKDIIALAAETAPQPDNPETSSQDKTAESDTDSDLEIPNLEAINPNKPQTKTLGSADPCSGYKFELQLTSKGAAIAQATFSEFDDRNPKNPQPLNLLRPVPTGKNSQLLSMANGRFDLLGKNKNFPLDILNWQTGNIIKKSDGSQKLSFTATLGKVAKQEGPKKLEIELIRFTKTFTIMPDSYNIQCDITVENLSDTKLDTSFDLTGPVGIVREAVRSDMRKVIGGFLTADDKIVSSSQGAAGKMLSRQKGLKELSLLYQQARRTGNKAQMAETKKLMKIGSNLPDRQQMARFLWAATTNKYFTAIIRLIPDQNKDFSDLIADRTAWFYNPDGDVKANTGDETLGVTLRTAPNTLAPAGQIDSSKKYSFQLYIGPKDKKLFDNDPLYNKLGFVHTITFMPCCCLLSPIIRPMAFAIMALMNWMYTIMGPLGNYGVVIILLVFLVRILMHPITKKSQVSMMKMQKLGPMMEEIKKKYANNKTEMNKHVMALYREQGVSPMSSMLPMMIQMPIWISLWTAVYASIDLRGEPFLPFWITDLSAPDALFRFESSIIIPILKWKIESFNLLPLLMGLVMFLQQKLMPHSSSAQTNPQMAQQQKMMMIMMPLLFPIMLYKGPSGVNLYILTSITAGVIEQIIIRKHIRQKEAEGEIGMVKATSKTGGKAKKKKPKPFYRT